MSSNGALRAACDVLAAPKTMALIAVAAVSAIDFVELLHEPQRRRRPYPKKFRFAQRTSNLTELEFQSEYRLSRDAFAAVLGKIEPDIRPKRKRAASSLDADVKLAVTLRYCAGAAAGVGWWAGLSGPSRACEGVAVAGGGVRLPLRAH